MLNMSDNTGHQSLMRAGRVAMAGKRADRAVINYGCIESLKWNWAIIKVINGTCKLKKKV